MSRIAIAAPGIRAAMTVAAGVAVLSACAGENLFTGVTAGSQSGPSVQITEPTTGASAEIGDSILVEATVTAQSGAAEVVYTGIYEVEEDAAYTRETTDLNGLVNLALSNYLRAVPGQRAGTAVVVVEATDQTGASGADTVTVSISAGVTN